MIGLLFDLQTSYDLGMEKSDSSKRPAPQELHAELERSREDLAAGRCMPLASVLTAIHTRATQRLERRRRANEAGEQRPTDPR
jgi:hypothetical protein